MDARVTRLENDMGEVRAILSRMEPMIVRIDAQMPFLATKEELASLRGESKEELASFRGAFKEELASMRGESKEELASFRGEFKEELALLRGEFKGELASLRGEFKEELASFRGEFRTDIATLQGGIMTELAHKPTRAAMWTMGIALFGLVVAAMAAGAAYLPYIAERLNTLK